jgi:hypothetical protein
MGVGGPPRSHATTRIADATVTVTDNRTHSLLATSRVGNLALRLVPGRYTVEASLLPGHICGARTVSLTSRDRRPRKLTLYCSIK